MVDFYNSIETVLYHKRLPIRIEFKNNCYNVDGRITHTIVKYDNTFSRIKVYKSNKGEFIVVNGRRIFLNEFENKYYN